MPSWLIYPTREPDRLVQFGPYPFSAAIDAEVEGHDLPLVVISHGYNGSPWTHRGTAAHLARSGFTVALVEHTGNSRSDSRLAATVANLENRPRHLHLVINAALENAHVGPHISTAGISIIGHSIGAYTALAIAGGKPWATAHETPDGKARPLTVVYDTRIIALVLLAPATIWFLPEGSLRDVDVPIFMRTGELDDITAAPNANIVLRGVRNDACVDHHVVRGAGHFSFQSPFPPAMTRPGFPPSQDPPGFDRGGFESILNAEIESFLRAAWLRQPRTAL